MTKYGLLHLSTDKLLTVWMWNNYDERVAELELHDSDNPIFFVDSKEQAEHAIPDAPYSSGDYQRPKADQKIRTLWSQGLIKVVEVEINHLLA